MDGYYETLVSDVKKKITQELFNEAFSLLEEEFKMPYIPKEYEEQLIPLYNACKSELRSSRHETKYNEEDIESLLFGSIDEAYQAIDIIKGSNLRRHLDVIERYLLEQPHFLIRSLLIECLIEQEISDEVHLQYDDLEIDFIPSYVELPQEQDGFKKAVKKVSEYYENDNPSFLLMCIECMFKEMYFKLPFSLEEDEINYFVYAILMYVYKANDDKEGFIQFIHEKNLANYGGYDLLLYKYDI